MGVGVSSVESSGFVPLCICLWLLMGQCTSRRAGQLCVCETVGERGRTLLLAELAFQRKGRYKRKYN